MSSKVRPDAAGVNAPSMNSSLRGCDQRGRLQPVGWVGGRAAAHAAYLVIAASSRAMPSPGAGGTRRTPSATGPDRLGEERVAPLGRPARRVVRELEERAAADPGRDVQVGQQADAVGPGVRGEPAVAGEGQLGERPRPEHPAGQDDVGLVDVERVGVQRGQPVARRSGSSRRRRSACRAPTRAAPARPRRSVAGQRLLDPQHAVRRRGAVDDPAGGDRVERRPTCRRPSASPG